MRAKMGGRPRTERVASHTPIAESYSTVSLEIPKIKLRGRRSRPGATTSRPGATTKAIPAERQTAPERGSAGLTQPSFTELWVLVLGLPLTTMASERAKSRGEQKALCTEVQRQQPHPRRCCLAAEREAREQLATSGPRSGAASTGVALGAGVAVVWVCWCERETRPAEIARGGHYSEPASPLWVPATPRSEAEQGARAGAGATKERRVAARGHPPAHRGAGKPQTDAAVSEANPKGGAGAGA